MNSWKKPLSLLLAGATMLGLLAGCGNGGTTATNAPTTAPTTAATNAPSTAPTAEAVTSSFDGKNLSVCVASEPQTMDPARSSTVDGAIMFSHLFEGLLKRVDDGNGNAKIVDGLSESHEKSEPNADGEVTWTFHLRDGLKWSDGQPMTASDIVYSWQRLANPDTAADYCYQLDMVKNYAAVQDKSMTPDQLGISAPDDKTVEIVLSYDCPYFGDIAAFPATFPVRQDMIEKNGDAWSTSDNVAEYISNGPYKLDSWINNSYIKVVRNENYYGTADVQIDSITFALMDDANAMLASYRSGDLQFIEQFPTDEIPGLIANGELQIVPYLGTYFVCFETTKAPWDNASVRKAFTLALDRNYIVEKVTQTGELPADAYVSPGIYDADGPSSNFHDKGNAPYWSTDAADLEANIAEANKLLDEAGFTDRSTFPVVEYIYNTGAGNQKVAEALQEMWQTNLGVKVQISNMDWNAFVDARKKGEYSVARHGWIADYNDPMSYIDMWMTGGGNNDAHWTNAEFDNLVKQAKSTSVQSERMSLMHQAEDILMDQSPICPIYFYTNKYILDPTVKGMVYDPMGFFIFTYCTKG